jgi:flagellar hook-associated protein 1 FlgK
MSVTTILDTAKQAMFAQQRAIQVAGQNIANVNTPGYSRQQPVFLPVHASMTGVLRLGVSVDQVTRAHDRFLTSQVQQAATEFAGAQTQADLLIQVEALFNELSLEEAGLSGALERLFAGFQELASNPRGIPERLVVQSQGQTVAELFHGLNAHLEEFRRNLNTTLKDELAESNRLIREIAELNGRIQQVEVDPKNHANTLRDERDRLLKTLAEKVNITSFETSDGAVTVLLGGERPLVEGNFTSELVTVVDVNDPLRLFIHIQDRQGNRTDVSDRITNGKVHALTEIRDTVLPSYIHDVDRLAAQLIGAVNNQHSQGYGLNGSTGHSFFAPREASGLAAAANSGGGTLQNVAVFDPTQLTLDDYRIDFVSNGPPPTFDIVNSTTGVTVAAGQSYTAGATLRFDGIAVTLNDNGTAPQQGDTFTISSTKGAAKNIAVASAIFNDVRNIAAAQTPDAGDNTNALALAGLQDAALIDGSTLSEFYHTLVSRVGKESQSRTNLAEHQQLLLTEVENQRESLAGVSLDEEQLDLIRFQQAFAAAANLVSIADELADIVINMAR